MIEITFKIDFGDKLIFDKMYIFVKRVYGASQVIRSDY